MRKSTTALVALAATAVITIMAPSALAGPDQANPPAENDLIFQGAGHTLWYYHAPNPVSASQAPAFTGSKIAGPGTTYGG